MEKIEKSGVNGLCKLFLYQHFVVTRLSWPFLVHDLCLTFANELEEIATKRLKAWSGLYRSADVGALYRQREHLGLQLTSISSHFKHLQVTKSCLLSTSQDPRIQEIFSRKQERVNAFNRVWSGPKALTELDPVVEHNLRFAGQTDRRGLGSQKNTYLAKPSVPEVRAKTTEILNMLEEEKRVNHSSCLAQQGVWTHWDDVRPFDLSWNNLIYGPGPKIIAFVLNSQINSVKTPDMLKLWGYIPSAQCPLCSHKKCTLHHILVGCRFALDQGRYNWRHDSVLFNLEPALANLIAQTNQHKPKTTETLRKTFRQSFVREGLKAASRKGSTSPRQSLLTVANDWKLLVDYEHKKIVFPPHIFSTSQRPDVIIWSRMSRNVVLLELTCCAEEGVKAAQLRKEVRYHELVESIGCSGWNAKLLTLEVGARGLIGNSTFRAFEKLGFASQAASTLCKTLSAVVARCSYAICLAQDSRIWSHNEDLVVG
jgi:hypothetical protein